MSSTISVIYNFIDGISCRTGNSLINAAAISENGTVKQEYIIALLAATLALVALAGMIAFLKYRAKKKTNLILEAQNETITLQKEQTSKTLRELQLIQQEQSKLISELNNSKMIIEQDANKLLRLSIQLKETEKELRALNETKDKFFSIISHDLRSPLGSFKNMTELLSEHYDELEDSEKKSLLYELNNSARHVYSLLDNLLTWSRAQRGAIDYYPENIDLNYIAANNILLLKMAARKKNIRLVSEIKSDTIVYADLNSLNTVIRNLISNAIKFTNENGQIVISATVNGAYISASVADNGVGMDKEALEKLFKIDNPVTTVGTSNERGTGLGLILCKEFVERNGGQISVSSMPGKGSVFTFTIPVAYNEA